MKFLLTLLSFSIIPLSIFSQKLVYCDDFQEHLYTRVSAKNLLVEFKKELDKEDIDQFIKALNLKIFTYKNDVLIIDREIIYDYDKTDYIILYLSKRTKISGLKDPALTLQDDEFVSFFNFFYYTNDITNHRLSYKNLINANLRSKIVREYMADLAEKYSFDYEYNRFSTAVEIEMLSDANISPGELTCILYDTGYFKRIWIEMIYIGMPTVTRYKKTGVINYPKN